MSTNISGMNLANINNPLLNPLQQNGNGATSASLEQQYPEIFGMEGSIYNPTPLPIPFEALTVEPLNLPTFKISLGADGKITQTEVDPNTFLESDSFSDIKTALPEGSNVTQITRGSAPAELFEALEVSPSGSYGIKYTTAEGTEETAFFSNGSPKKLLGRQAVDENGVTILEARGDNNQVVQRTVTQKDGTSTTQKFNDSGVVEQEVIQNGSTTITTQYDSEGNPTSKTAVRGKQTFTIDPNSNKVTGSVTTNTINGENYEITETYSHKQDGSYTATIKNPLHPNETIKKTCDANGALIKTTTSTTSPSRDGWRVTTNVTTNRNGEVISRTGTYTRRGENHKISYDGNGNMLTAAKYGESFDDTAARLGIRPGTAAYDKFVELNPSAAQTGSFKIAGKGNHGVVKVPEGTEDIINISALNVDPAKENKAKQRAEDEAAVARTDVSAYNETNTQKSKVPEGTSSWWALAKQNLKDCGTEHPTDAQINQRRLEIQKLNQGTTLAVGAEITVPKTNATKAEEVRQAEATRQTEAQAKAEQTASAKIESKAVFTRLMNAKGFFNDNENAMREALDSIGDNPKTIAMLNKLLQKDYPAKNGFSPIENFIQTELKGRDVQEYTQKWISTGALSGQAAIEAQARMAFREITQACDGAGTDVSQLMAGTRLIKSPVARPEPQNSTNAQAVYAHVNKLLSQHRGGQWSNFEAYVKGDVWKSEVRDLKVILANNGAIVGKERAEILASQTVKAVGGAGTNITRLKDSLAGIRSPQEMAAYEAQLKAQYGDNVTPQNGQTYLEAVLYAECDKWDGIRRDYNEIREFTENLISQGAYTPEQAAGIRGRINADQIRKGEFEDAFAGITDAASYNATAKALGGNIDAYLSRTKGKSQTAIDLLNADLASRGILTDSNKIAGLSSRLIMSDDFHSRAMGFAAINQNADVARMVDEQLKANGSSLSEQVESFQTLRARYANAGNIVDKAGNAVSWITGGGFILDEIASQLKADTNVSDNVYVACDPKDALPAPSADVKAAYTGTIEFMEAELQQLKDGFKASKDGQGIISGAVNRFCQARGIGTTRADIQQYIEKQETAIKDLKLAASGRLMTHDGNHVSFETAYQKYMGVTFNPSAAKNVNTQGQQLAYLQHANEELPAAWTTLNNALDSNDTALLTDAILNTKTTLTRFTGVELSFAEGYSLSQDGQILNAEGQPLTASQLKDMARQFQNGLADVTNTVYGLSGNNAIKSGCGDIKDRLADAFEAKQNQFKAEYKAFYGKEPAGDILKSYNKTIDTGKKIFNAAVIIGAAVAAPFTGGGSLSGVLVGMASTAATVGTASYVAHTIESATDSDGLSLEENTANLKTAAKDGIGAAAGFGIGKGATALSNVAANKVGANVTENILGKFAQGESVNVSRIDLAMKTTRIATKFTTSVAGDLTYAVAADYVENGEMTSGIENKVIAAAAGTIGSTLGEVLTTDNSFQPLNKLGLKATAREVGSAITAGAALPLILGGVDLEGLPEDKQQECAKLVQGLDGMSVSDAKAAFMSRLNELPDGPYKDSLIMSFEENPMNIIQNARLAANIQVPYRLP